MGPFYPISSMLTVVTLPKTFHYSASTKEKIARLLTLYQHTNRLDVSRKVLGHMVFILPSEKSQEIPRVVMLRRAFCKSL